MKDRNSLPASYTEIQWLTANSIKITADRDHDKVIITLPCGEQRHVERNEFDNLVRRLKEAQTWLRPSSAPNVKEF